MNELSRRGVLVGGGAALGGILAAAPGMSLMANATPGARALAAVTPGGGALSGGYSRVDVTHSAYPYRGNTDLHGDPTYQTVSQAMFLEQNTGDLFVKQKMRSKNSSGGTDTSGDLVITRRTYNSSTGGWDFGDRMILLGFGHGASFSAWYDGSSYWLWIECKANTSSGYGTAICYVKYQKGTTITNSDVTPLYPFGEGGTGNVSCVARYDNTHSVVVRYHLSGESTMRYQVWDITDAKNGNFSGRGLLGTPAVEPSNSYFNGWTFKGQYVYFITGTGNVTDKSNPGYLTVYSFDLNNPSSVAKDLKSAQGTLSPREPEGMFFDTTSGTKVVFAMTSGGIEEKLSYFS